MAGGIILLSVMVLFFEPITAIALHGLIQLVSNVSRTAIQRHHVEWRFTWRFALLLFPMGLLGIQLAFALPPNASRVLIGLFVLAATWRPGWLMLGTHPADIRPERRFLLLGGVVGFLGVLVGATGPLAAPFFLNLGLARQGIVGTKAATQTLGHISKTLIFGISGFAFRDYVPVLVLMWLAVIAGTWVGSRLLERVEEQSFDLLYRGALTLVALRLIMWDGWKLVASG
jgi:uncharacterized membrane protein YfcA